MNVDLSAFGTARSPLSAEVPVIYIVHGFASDPASMTKLEARLTALLPSATIHRFGHHWPQSVVRSGAELADAAFNGADESRPLFFVGHSMGGLVSRVANVILTDPTGFAARVPRLSSHGYQDDVNQIKKYALEYKPKRKVNGIVTLATPNSGAMLQGQVSLYLALLQAIVAKVSSFRHPSVQDLTTDRLFRLLQHFSSSTPVLSISGSKMNRFTIGAGQILRTSGQLGLNLTLPHDLVVEDISVDLDRSILPNEITHHGSSPYIHLRAYENCTDVWHSSIHDNSVVAAYIADFASRC